MNCKPGDLAYIVRDPYPENVGRVVRVIGPNAHAGGPEWDCESCGAPLRVLDPARPWAFAIDARFDCYDADLRPISGVPVEDEVCDEVMA